MVTYKCDHIQAENATLSELERALGALNSHLATTTYLVRHFVTLAHIIMTCNLALGLDWIMTKVFTSKFHHVERYYWTMTNQPNFHKVMGEPKQTEAVPHAGSAQRAKAKGI